MIYAGYTTATTDTYDIESISLPDEAQQNGTAEHPGNSASDERQPFTCHATRCTQSLPLSCKDIHNEFKAELERGCISSDRINVLSPTSIEWPHEPGALLINVKQCTITASVDFTDEFDVYGLCGLLRLLSSMRYGSSSRQHHPKESHELLKLRRTIALFMNGICRSRNLSIDTLGATYLEDAVHLEKIELHFDGVASQMTRLKNP
jgi:hypothetical protein